MTHRVDVRCEAETGGGWADLVGAEAALRALTAGTRVLVEIARRGGGFANYPILSLVRVGGRSQAAVRPDRVTPDPADDFNEIRPAATRAGITLRCAVDFVSAPRFITERDRRRYEYPAEMYARLDVKCRGPRGEAWVELLVGPGDGDAVLVLAPGHLATVAVLALEGGVASRPVVRLHPGPDAYFLDHSDRALVPECQAGRMSVSRMTRRNRMDTRACKQSPSVSPTPFDGARLATSGHRW
jgi:hypothetical protein